MIATGRDAAVTTRGETTVIDRAAVAEAGGLPESVTVTVKRATPSTDAAPEMVPVLEFRVSPVGSVPVPARATRCRGRYRQSRPA